MARCRRGEARALLRAYYRQPPLRVAQQQHQKRAEGEASSPLAAPPLQAGNVRLACRRPQREGERHDVRITLREDGEGGAKVLSQLLAWRVVHERSVTPLAASCRAATAADVATAHFVCHVCIVLPMLPHRLW